ncbi:response regulator [Thiohalocapsa marina]|uniref:histidine kinase n=1 Tax=Thiohalocapsa marina TaxID=424902 RepID=A0A5M8FP80_9GAMM|nr:hybrid sensor histidine kinase/response regulator [Thiohalocapsa marina]KAA6185486.1 response regulator [Thiohalocapsa marina]
MNSRRRPHIFSLRTRMIALAVVPVLVIALSTGGYMIHSRFIDLHQALHERGQIMANNLAMAAELPLLTRDLAHLEALCASTLQQPDVFSAAIHDADRKTALTQCGPPGHADHSDRYDEIFSAAVGSVGVQVSDFDPAAQGPLTPLGWVEIRLSGANILQRQRQILSTSLLIVFGGILTSLFAALHIGGGISRPLLALSDAMRRYRRGEQGVRIRPGAPDEIGELARDFNRMAWALEQSQTRLRKQVDAATEELRHTVASLKAKNAELVVAREAADRAGREKYDFLARMSHEIRTPLNAVIGFSRLLHDSPNDDSSEEYSRTIDQAANQLLCVIDGVLNFTKLESGNLELETQPFDPRSCLEDVIAMIGPAARDRGLELALVIQSDMPRGLQGDRHRLSQILVNLLDNAVKFTSQGHVLLEACYDHHGPNAGQLRLLVEDTGIGLSDEARERLFQPFVQADSSITRRYGGTGLGLVICQRLVRLMGGRIQLHSRPGQGSRFQISIPCPTAELAPNPSPDLPTVLRPAQQPAPLPAAPLAGRKVLLCERRPLQRKAVLNALLGWSMQVEQATDPDTLPNLLSRAAAAGNGFDLVVLGLDADQTNTDSVQSLLAGIHQGFDGPLLVLAGSGPGDLPAPNFMHPDVAWASKPIRLARLHRKLCHLLAPTAASASPAQPDTAQPRHQGQRVLVAEDNAFNRLLLQRLLGMRSIRMQEVTNGLDAIDAARQDTFDLILMDIHMPDLDGIETARRIRRQHSEQGTTCPPIVALTADVFARDRHSAEDWPFDGLILKPISETILDQTLADMPARDSAAASAASAAKAATSAVTAASVASAASATTTASTASAKSATSPPPTAGNPGPTTPTARTIDLQQALQQELQNLLQRLTDAVDRADRPAIRDLAHQLKGCCGFFDQRELEAAARTLEVAAPDVHMDTLRQHLRELEAMVG